MEPAKLAERIENDFLTAFKAKNNELLVAVLRLLKTAIKNAAITKKGELTDEEILKVIAGEAKKRKDAIISYRQGNREELAVKEEQELVILEKYLPAQLSEADVQALVDQVMASAGEVLPKDFGKIMSQVMAKAQGQADGGLVSRLVKEAINR
ncbi:MAG: GatB/YqeY domain-containing protein [bacterium]